MKKARKVSKGIGKKKQLGRKRKKPAVAKAGTGDPAEGGTIFSVLYDPFRDLKESEWFDFSNPRDKGWKRLAKLRENHDSQQYKKMTGSTKRIGGLTRIGGLPHVPADFKWPLFRKKGLPFVAQLDLASIKSGAQNLLPETGYLLFFALVSNNATVAPVVRYFECPRSQLALATPPDQRWKDWMDNDHYHLSAMSKFVGPGEKSTRTRGVEVAKLFGQPELEPDLPGATASLENMGGADWITLFTIYSRNNMQWSDSGELHFFARRSDLESVNFDETLMAIDSG